MISTLTGRPVLCSCGALRRRSQLPLVGRLARRRQQRRPLPLGAVPPADRLTPTERPDCDDDKLRRRPTGAANLTDEQKQQQRKQQQAEEEEQQQQQRPVLYRRQSSERWDLLTGRLRRLIRGDLTRLTQRPRLGDLWYGAASPPLPSSPVRTAAAAAARPAVRSAVRPLLRGPRRRLAAAAAAGLRRCGVCAGLRTAVLGGGSRRQERTDRLRDVYQTAALLGAALLLLRLLLLMLCACCALLLTAG